MSLTLNLRDKTHATLRSMIRSDAKTICIIDPPNYSNVGDSAIFLGQLDALATIAPDANIWFTDHLFYSNRCRKKLLETDLIMFMGGGNFGDLWPTLHNFRLKILTEFPEISKIQFPQSIHFKEKKYLEATTKAIKEQRDLHLLVRDQKSFDLSSKVFDCNVVLCPDMVFSMRSFAQREPAVEIAMLWREDQERAEDRKSVAKAFLDAKQIAYVERDWIAPDHGFSWKLDLAVSARRAGRLGSVPGFYRLLLWAREQYAIRRVKIGLDYLSQGKVVATDRLHGMILSHVADRPSIVLDSLDGKVGAFFHTWMAGKSEVNFVSDRSQLIASLEDRFGR